MNMCDCVCFLSHVSCAVSHPYHLAISFDFGRGPGNFPKPGFRESLVNNFQIQNDRFLGVRSSEKACICLKNF